MLFRQVLHEDLGCASYLIADSEAKAAAVVDPQWDMDPYLRLARLHGLRIEHVLETHTHADHVSGHGRLAAATGATIHVHELAEAEYPHEPFTDGWTLELGQVAVEAIHTPGHRPEHSSFLLRDLARGGEPWAVLTGDSLFVGDVARPDLAIEPADGAAGIYRSLHERLLTLPDEVEVWPGHLGGSLCGTSSIDQKTSSTIGFERGHNRAVGFSTEAEFVADALATVGARPPNVEMIVGLNRGPLLERGASPQPLSPREVASAQAEGAAVIDSRTSDQFDDAHVPGALSVSAQDTGFATRLARVVEPDADLVLVAGSDEGRLRAVELLESVGLRAHGYLDGGMTAWRSEDRPVERIEMIRPSELARRLRSAEPPQVLDVRDPDEWLEGHIPGALNIPYAELDDRAGELDPGRPVAAICSGGKRSALAASILRRAGIEAIHVAHGGVETWRAEGHPVEGVAPATAG